MTVDEAPVGNYVWKESHGFEFKCRSDCKQPCTRCFKYSFEKPPKKLAEKPPKKNDSRTAVGNFENELDKIPKPFFGNPTKTDKSQVQNEDENSDKIPMPAQDSTEDRRNFSTNKERSRKMMWKLPDKCFQDKCDACRNNSCCRLQGN